MVNVWDPKRPLVASQPGKLLYTIYFIITALLKVPPYALLYLIPSFRPVSSWPYKAALSNKLASIGMRYTSNIRAKTPQPVVPGKEKHQFVALKPATSQQVYHGLLSNPEIQPTTIAGLWLPNLNKVMPAVANGDGWVILYFHGGAYVLLNVRDPLLQQGPQQIYKELPADGVLSVDYRLSSNSKSSHPAQLQDAITAYNYLIHDLHVSPSRILVSGDSAGGHLSLLLLRHLMATQESTGLPLPRALLLHSPWLDLRSEATSVDSLGISTDYLSDAFLKWGTDTFLPAGVASDSEIVCPARHPFKSPVPIWVQAGTVEMFFPTIKKWVEDMKAASSVIELHEMKDMPHDVFVLAADWGLKEELSKGIQAAKDFLDRLA